MGKTTLQKLAILVATGFLLGLIYALCLTIVAGMAYAPLINKPLLLNMSIIEMQFYLVPIVLFIFLGFISVLVTQGDTIVLFIDRGGRRSPPHAYPLNEAFPGFSASGAILIAVFYGTVFGVIGALSLASDNLKSALDSIQITGIGYIHIFYIAIYVLAMLLCAETCGVGVFFMAYRRNRISEKSRVPLPLYALQPLFSLLFLILVSMMFVFPQGTNAMLMQHGSKMTMLTALQVALIFGSFLTALGVFKLIDRFAGRFQDVSPGIRVNTVAAFTCTLIFLVVMFLPLLILAPLYIGAGGGMVAATATDYTKDPLIGAWQSSMVDAPVAYVDNLSGTSQPYNWFDRWSGGGIEKTTATYHGDTYTFAADGTYTRARGDETIKGIWTKIGNDYYLDRGIYATIYGGDLQVRTDSKGTGTILCKKV